LRLCFSGSRAPALRAGAAAHEWLTRRAPQDGAVGARGFELVTVQGGAEYRVTPRVAVGPFFSFSLARYTTMSSENMDTELADKRMHEWLQLGVRGRIGL